MGVEPIQHKNKKYKNRTFVKNVKLLKKYAKKCKI